VWGKNKSRGGRRGPAESMRSRKRGYFRPLKNLFDSKPLEGPWKKWMYGEMGAAGSI